MNQVVGIIGTAIGGVAGMFEICTRFIPFLRRKFPSQFGLDYSAYHDVEVFLLREQVYKEQWINIRTVMGLYNDIRYKLDVPKLKVGCCPIRILNLTEFYNIILLSNDWRKMNHAEFIPTDAAIRKNRNWALKLQPDIDDQILDDISKFYWGMNKEDKQ